MGVRKRILCFCAGALLAASSSMGTDLSEVPCEPFPSLEMKMAGVVYEAVTKEKRFEITWSSDRPDRLGAIDDDGWRTVEYFFQETVLVDGQGVKPWRQRIATARVRWEGETCELADLEFVRDWRIEVTEHVADRCFRYYAATIGKRGIAIDKAIRTLRDVNGSWIEDMVVKVANDSALQGEGRSLGMFYGQYRLSCEAEIDAGRVPFSVPGGA